MKINVIRKTPDVYGIYHYITNVNENQFDEEEWYHSPDISPEMLLISTNYWKFVDDTVVEMTLAEKQAVDSSLSDIQEEDDSGSGTSPVIITGESNKIVHNIYGCRVYLIQHATYARTWNVSYGPAYVHWSSAVLVSKPHYRMNGFSRTEKFVPKKLIMDGFFSNAGNTEVKVIAFKLKKDPDRWTQTGEVIWSTDIVGTATHNKMYEWDLPDDVVFEEGEEIAFAWQRTDSEGGTRYFYFNAFTVELERVE